MGKKSSDRSDEIRAIMIETLEVQLAALRSGITFWTEWANRTSEYTEVASRGLSDINTHPEDTDRVLSEIIEAGSTYFRKMNEIPQASFSKFTDELAKAKQISPRCKTVTPKISDGSKTKRKKATGSRTRVARAKD